MKGRLWCADLRTAHLQVGAPKPITLIVPYYESPVFFARQLALWAAYPAELAAWLSIIVVDDGSPTDPAHRGSLPVPMLRIFRIGVDVRWNWLAARNIGFRHAKPGWCLVTDMDHVVPPETLEACIYHDHDPRTAYAFQRQEHTGTRLAPHSASFFLTRETFWRTGGYDETLAGHYGTDGDFRRRLAMVATLALLPESLIRYEFVDDASVTRYQRKQPEDAGVRRIVASRRAGWAPKVLSFPYWEVAC